MTVGKSSITADGAAALMMVSAERASELGLRMRNFFDVMVLFATQQLS